MLPGTATFSDGPLVTPMLRRASDIDRRRAKLMAFGLSHAMSSVVGGSSGVIPSQSVALAIYDNAAAVSLWDLLYGDEAREEAKGAAKDEVEDTLAALGTAPPSEPLDIKSRRRRERMGQEALKVIQGATVPTLCSFTVSDAAPKMVFVGGQGSILLRSVDRCRTWRTIEIVPSEVVISAESPHQEERGEEDDDKALDDILNLINPAHEETGPEKVVAARPDIYQVRVSEAGGVVAVCGQDGLLAVGADSGRTFTSYPRTQLDAFEFNGKRTFVNKLRSPQRLVGIHGVEFLYTEGGNGRHSHEGPHVGAVAFSSASGVFVAGYSIKGLGTVVFTFMYQVAAVQEVGCIRVVGDSLWISAKGTLFHCCYGQGGAMAVTEALPHKGGTIRSMAFMPPSSLEALEKTARAHIIQTLSDDTTRVLTTNGEGKGKGARRGYSYSAATPTTDESTYQALSGCGSITVGGVPFVLFHAMGTGTEVMDYDFSTVLAIGCAAHAEDGPMLISTLINTSYTSLVKSAGAAEKLGTAVAMGTLGTSLIRSNRSGISTSADGGMTWSTPTHAFTGEVEAGPRRSGEPFCIGCGSKQCVVLSSTAFQRSSKGDSGCEVVTLNASLRTKMLYTIAAQW